MTAVMEVLNGAALLTNVSAVPHCLSQEWGSAPKNRSNGCQEKNKIVCTYLQQMPIRDPLLISRFGFMNNHEPPWCTMMLMHHGGMYLRILNTAAADCVSYAQADPNATHRTSSTRPRHQLLPSIPSSISSPRAEPDADSRFNRQKRSHHHPTAHIRIDFMFFQAFKYSWWVVKFAMAFARFNSCIHRDRYIDVRKGKDTGKPAHRQTILATVTTSTGCQVMWGYQAQGVNHQTMYCNDHQQQLTPSRSWDVYLDGRQLGPGLTPQMRVCAWADYSSFSSKTIVDPHYHPTTPNRILT